MGSSSAARWSQFEWIVRALIVLVLLAVGFVAVRHTLAASLENRSPAQAHQLAPTDGRNAAALSQRAFLAARSPDERAHAHRLAKLALQRDPTAVSAVAVVGLEAQVRGDATAARAAFAYAQRLSRRHLTTQLWAIEDAVARNDVLGALRHYDIALRTSRRATDVLFPVLGAAIADPSVREALVRTLVDRPSWQSEFISFVSVNGTDPAATAELFMALRSRGHLITDQATAAVTTAMLRGGFAEAAWRYYATVRDGVSRRRSRDPDFRAELAEATPFDWMTVNNDGPSASLQTSPTGGVLYFSAPSGIGGPVLRQQQLLLPGTYRLNGRSRSIEGSENAQPYWLLQCDSGRELGRVAVSAEEDFIGTFTVPAGCEMQMLSLVLRPSDMVTGISGQIARAELQHVEAGQ